MEYGLAPGVLLDALAACVFTCGPGENLPILGANAAFFRLFGGDMGELHALYGGAFAALLHPDEVDRVRAALADLGPQGAELELRARRKNGAALRVLCQVAPAPGGGSCWVATDITRRQKSQEALRLSAERMQVIMDQTNDILFQWDLVEDVVHFSSNWRSRFGYPPVTSQATAHLTASLNIYPEDREVYLALLAAITGGAPYSEAEYRIMALSGQYLWHRARATVQFDDEGRPVRAVGILLDISAEKGRELELLERSRKDSLTDLYNQSAVRTQVERLMAGREEDTLQALMIVDLDDFKGINDRHGHLCGDAVLTALATVLKGLFRASDKVGRIGGDEFLAFLSGLPSREAAIHKAQALLCALGHIPLGDTGLQGLSCSIGIAFCPDHGGDYAQLYHCADQALYRAKDLGKQGWSVYTPAPAAEAAPSR